MKTIKVRFRVERLDKGIYVLAGATCGTDTVPGGNWDLVYESLSAKLRDGVEVELEEPAQRPTDAEYTALGRLYAGWVDGQRYLREPHDMACALVEREHAGEREAQEPVCDNCGCLLTSLHALGRGHCDECHSEKPALPPAQEMADVLVALRKAFPMTPPDYSTPELRVALIVADAIRAARGEEKNDETA